MRKNIFILRKPGLFNGSVIIIYHPGHTASFSSAFVGRNTVRDLAQTGRADKARIGEKAKSSYCDSPPFCLRSILQK
jgi:hypothetical protein